MFAIIEFGGATVTTDLIWQEFHYQEAWLIHRHEGIRFENQASGAAPLTGMEEQYSSQTEETTRRSKRSGKPTIKVIKNKLVETEEQLEHIRKQCLKHETELRETDSNSPDDIKSWYQCLEVAFMSVQCSC